jgi:hypothetical protein
MAERRSPPTHETGRIDDARGRRVTQLDPVKLHLLNQRSVIPAEALRSMVDQILPGARRQRLFQILSLALGFILIVGGNIIYFRHFSTWKGFDPVNVTIYVVQLVIILSGPLLAFRIARAKYVSRVASVMLKHRHCPHCGYDIRGLPVDPTDGATVCPECGCAWDLDAGGDDAGCGGG